MRDNITKKLKVKKNKYCKSVHNLKHTRFNKLRANIHNVSKETINAYVSMSPIYLELDNAFGRVDLVDLEMYERWLNE